MAITTRDDDTHCSRLIFDQVFFPDDDIYISFNVGELVLTTEREFDILTVEGLPLVIEKEFVFGTGLAISLFLNPLSSDDNVTSKNDRIDLNRPNQPSSGIGLGLMSISGTNQKSVSGHVATIATDYTGGFALKNIFQDPNGNTITNGLVSQKNDSVTCRLSTNNFQYDFLSSTDIPSLSSTIDSYRFGFRNNLNIMSLDVSVNNEYQRIFEAEANNDIEGLHHNNVYTNGLRLGISYSGNDGITVKDFTYSGKAST
jgi:hypothetical protein